MTVKAYIKEKLRAFGITEAQLLDAFVNLDIHAADSVTTENINEVGLALVSAVEELLFAPFQSSVNENGFSVSWDVSNLSKYYLWLCRKYGVTPSQNVLENLGMSMIIDKTDTW